MKTHKEVWGSRIGLILAASGSAVGLGNFLRFPVQAVQNGGGSFIIPYMVCFFIMGIPLLLIEWSLGRLGGRHGNHGNPYILKTLAKGAGWRYIGAMALFCNLCIAAYYCYIESWTLFYTIKSLFGGFSGMNQQEVVSFFGNYISIFTSSGIHYTPIIFYILCLLLNSYILSKGLSGIEKVSKIGMSALLFFGVLLAVKGWTMGTSGANAQQPDLSAWDGFNFLWTPQFETIWDPKIWLAAAGQVFFTISVGLGIIYCYASYIDVKKDVALNALSSGFTNEFVEVILAGAIIIPIAAGYLGLDWVKENAGFGMAFQTMPYLFEKWGRIMAPIGGLLWFGLLFLAGITSSISLGISWMGLSQNEFRWSRGKSAWTYGLVLLIIGLPTVLFFDKGFFDEYDYWAGTISIVLLAFFEVLLFVKVLGIERGWREIHIGADIRLPVLFKYLIRYVVPYMLLLILTGAVFTPLNNDWKSAFKNLFSGNGWALDNGSLIKKVAQSDLHAQMAQATDLGLIETLKEKIFYIDMARIFLLIFFIFCCVFIHLAYKKRYQKRIL